MDALHVLIIDDDKDTANFFSTVLSLVGFECEIVNSAKHALSRLASSQPDMILLDMRLGLEIGGEDILYQIRSNPRLDQTRVIVITAYPSLAEPIANLADLILLKPVEVDQLRTLSSRLMLRGERMKRFHYRDPVTDLFNRDFFLTRLEHAFERVRRRPDFLFALLVFQIDIKPAGDHEMVEADSDLVFCQVAERLRKGYRPTDTIARLDGNQFVSLHEDLKHPDDVQVLIYRLRGGLATPFMVEDREYRVCMAIGAAIYSSAYTRTSDFLNAAFQAMEGARQIGEDEFLIVEPKEL